MEDSRRRCGCCTFVLHVASSSRSQVLAATASTAARLIWGQTIRGCPLAFTVVGGDCYSVAREPVSWARLPGRHGHYSVPAPAVTSVVTRSGNPDSDSANHGLSTVD
jgi:hypothetical protein